MNKIFQWLKNWSPVLGAIIIVAVVVALFPFKTNLGSIGFDNTNNRVSFGYGYFQSSNLGGNDSFAKSLLHFDGVNATTTFTESGTARTWTANGNAQISTAQYKFGNASALFDGSGDYISTPSSTDWDLGTGDFTIEWWWRLDNNGIEQVPFGIVDDVSNRFIVYYNGAAGTDYIDFYAVGGGSAGAVYTYNWTPANNTWYKMAYVRNGTDFKLYIDGTAVTFTSISAAIGSGAMPDLSASLEIGRQNLGAAFSYMDGYIEEFRWSKGVARYTANFTPERTAFGDDLVDFISSTGVSKQIYP